MVRADGGRGPATRATAGRSFGVADGLILVAATAAGLATMRMIVPEMTPGQLWKKLTTTPPLSGWSIASVLGMFIEFGFFLVIPCLVAWTLAWLVLRWRGPRTPRRRLVREPGAMACMAAAAAIAITAGGALALRPILPDPPDLRWVIRGVILGSVQAGAGVFWCWATMALCGRWRPEPTWLDRSGRLLGAAWLAYGLLYGWVAAGSVP